MHRRTFSRQSPPLNFPRTSPVRKGDHPRRRGGYHPAGRPGQRGGRAVAPRRGRRPRKGELANAPKPVGRLRLHARFDGGGGDGRGSGGRGHGEWRGALARRARGLRARAQGALPLSLFFFRAAGARRRERRKKRERNESGGRARWGRPPLARPGGAPHARRRRACARARSHVHTTPPPRALLATPQQPWSARTRCGRGGVAWRGRGGGDGKKNNTGPMRPPRPICAGAPPPFSLPAPAGRLGCLGWSMAWSHARMEHAVP